MTARALGASCAALWLATLAGAALAHGGAELQPVEAPRPALQATLATVGELLAHNTPVALWPLALVAIGWPGLAGARRVGDALIAAQLLAHGLAIGSALGQRPELWRYLPHLPLEWLALAIPAAAWLTARTRTTPPRDRRLGVPATTGAALAALAGAATIETYLTPRR